MKLKTIAVAVFGLAVLSSCSTQRSPLPYFEDINESTEFVVNTSDFAPKIQPDDELYIFVTSEPAAATMMYNLPMSNPAERDNGMITSSPQNQTYLVDSKGDIEMPILGTIHVGGLTIEQAKELITKKVSVDVENPLVTIRMINFHVDVAGEVKNPGRLSVRTQRYSILDALAEAGDLTEFGERNDILLVREEDGKRVAHRLNLNSADLLTSPYFYLQQNDYVYVRPNKIREDNSKYNQNNAFKVSVISTIVSGVSVIASLVIALTVK